MTADPEDVPRLMEEEEPHLVLLDMLLPGSDGMELMRDIRATADVPVIFLSVYGQDEAREDGGMKDADISGALGVGLSMVERVRRRCVEEGIESALNRKKQLRRRQKILDGEREARLIAMACGEPPEGRASWTLKLLADQLVECEIVETISTETVRQVLKKTNSSRG